jgi:amino acid transporter
VDQPKLSWRDGLYLVGPDPLTSPYYSSGALIVAGVGYATPAFQIGLYALLFLLAPLYIEAVLLTLSNGGTYVMTRYALSHLGKLAIVAAAVVGVIISFSYVATAIVSLLSYSDYVQSLASGLEFGRTAAAIGLSAIPALAFGLWVMPSQWRSVLTTVVVTSVIALVLAAFVPPGIVVMLAPLMLLFSLNNYGLRESVQVSKTIFLVNLAVMAVTIVLGLVYLVLNGADFTPFVDGVKLSARAVRAGQAAGHGAAVGADHGLGSLSGSTFLPGFATLGVALIPAALGSSILGASGVESVMNIPEELERPREDVRRIYRAMLTTLLVIGGSVSLLIFLVLEPSELVGASGYLLAVLGEKVVVGVTGSSLLGEIWNVVIVANAALMLLGATNTGFAGARGLWVTMARDNLLPRLVLNPNPRGAFERVHWLMLLAIFGLAWTAGADVSKLERWYGATFGLVLVSGVVAFILLRRFKAGDRRLYTAPGNVTIGGVRVPIAAFIGLGFLTVALAGLFTQYADDLSALRTLLVSVVVLVTMILLGYNHRPIIRAAYQYFRQTIETVEGDAIEIEDRTIVVAVGSVRVGRLLREAIRVARAQSQASRIPYRQVVVFHMTKTVRREHVYRVTPESVRPAGIEGNVVRIFTEMTELAPPDLALYLALVPNRHPDKDTLHSALDALVEFHEKHEFTGHIVLLGDYGVAQDDKDTLQTRLKESTLVWMPM